MLKPSVLYGFEILVKHFIETYYKISIKHNMVTLILGFKEKENETMMESIDRRAKRQAIAYALVWKEPCGFLKVFL